MMGWFKDYFIEEELSNISKVTKLERQLPENKKLEQLKAKGMQSSCKILKGDSHSEITIYILHW